MATDRFTDSDGFEEAPTDIEEVLEIVPEYRAPE